MVRLRKFALSPRLFLFHQELPVEYKVMKQQNFWNALVIKSAPLLSICQFRSTLYRYIFAGFTFTCLRKIFHIAKENASDFQKTHQIGFVVLCIKIRRILLNNLVS